MIGTGIGSATAPTPFKTRRNAFREAAGKYLGRDAQLTRLFNYLFRANVRDSRFGWQIVVVARKTSP